MAEEVVKQEVKLYVIMPFSKTSDVHTADYWDEHFTDFIARRITEVTEDEPSLNNLKWKVERSSVIRGGPLNYEIVWDLFTAPIAMVDLTDLNSNVLYELGIRHALNAALGMWRTIMIQEEQFFKLPFDFANYAVLKYRKDKVDTWKRDLRDRLKGCIDAHQYRDNPVSMTFAQHGYSFQQQETQQQQLEKMKLALDGVERLKNLGFDIEWIQELIRPTKKDTGPTG